MIDYVITSIKGIHFLQNFKVTDLDSLYSDGHALLSVDIRALIPLKHTDTVHQTHDGPITGIRSTGFDCFKNGINPTKTDEI